jgi:hypothetical protein
MKKLTLAQQKREDEKIKRQRTLRILIKTAFERGYSESEMIEAFNKETRENYELSPDNDEMVSRLSYEGYCIFKPDSSAKAEKLREYAENNIFPYYNEQRTAILY